MSKVCRKRCDLCNEAMPIDTDAGLNNDAEKEKGKDADDAKDDDTGDDAGDDRRENEDGNGNDIDN
jgi:hypothetical protein